MNISLSQDKDHDKHGMVVKLKGTKPPHIKQPTHIAMDVSGYDFWQLAANTFGEWRVRFARYDVWNVFTSSSLFILLYVPSPA